LIHLNDDFWRLMNLSGITVVKSDGKNTIGPNTILARAEFASYGKRCWMSLRQQ
jgi:hypothetical protein